MATINKLKPKSVRVRLTKDDKYKLDYLCEQKDCTMSELVRFLIRQEYSFK